MRSSGHTNSTQNLIHVRTIQHTLSFINLQVIQLAIANGISSMSHLLSKLEEGLLVLSPGGVLHIKPSSTLQWHLSRWKAT
jgi:hypothetical protein